MRLPVVPPVSPMLAKSVPEIPDGMHYEPKWDGFRAIIFRDGDEVEIGSRNERPLTRYFPEVVDAVRATMPNRCVIDGELVIARGQALDFEALQARIHPAASRVAKLAVETPASFVAFDLLALGDESLMAQPFRDRRATLERELGASMPPVFVTPATEDKSVAQHWFEVFEGAGLDGVVAKPFDIPYQPDKRVMYKIKHLRSADCVVAGFRWHKSGGVVGSLLLGLYDDDGQLQHVGVAGAFSMARRRELLDELEPYRSVEATHPWAPKESPGGRTPREAETSRWNAGKDLSFEALRPELVCEVSYDHLEGARFRHTAQFVRWRPDRTPSSCTFAQLDQPVSFDLSEVLGAKGSPTKRPRAKKG